MSTSDQQINYDYEKRLMGVEHTVGLLRERSDTVMADAKITNRILQDLEKNNVEIKSALSGLTGMVSDIRKDFDGLERHTETSQVRHTQDLKEFADTVVSALADVSESFKEVVMTATRALECRVDALGVSQEKTNKENDGRIKSLENFYWKVTGATGVLAALIGSFLPQVIKILTGGKT